MVLESTVLSVESMQMAFVVMIVPCTNSDTLDIPSSICRDNYQFLNDLLYMAVVIKRANYIGASYNDCIYAYIFAGDI